MWIPITIIVGLSVSIFLPSIIISSIKENGKIKDGKLICRCPTAFRVLLLIGVLVLSFCVSIFWKNGMKWINIVLFIVVLIFDFVFILACYICARYKIIIDISSQKIIIYSLWLLKKEISFLEPFYLKNGEIEIVKDKNKKVLFYFSGYMSGGGCLSNCLKSIISNNQKNEPIDIQELQRLLKNEKLD